MIFSTQRALYLANLKFLVMQRAMGMPIMNYEYFIELQNQRAIVSAQVKYEIS
jgi:hypothetical protein